MHDATPITEFCCWPIVEQELMGGAALISKNNKFMKCPLWMKLRPENRGDSYEIVISVIIERNDDRNNPQLQ
jgi:hypothetical protein